MEFLKNILIDSLNGFALKDIPFFLFQLLSAALLSQIFQIIWKKKYKTNETGSFAIMGTGFALLTVFAKYSVAFAVIALGVIVWMSRGQKKSSRNTISGLIVGIIGAGIGSGNVVLTVLGFIVLMIIFLFLPSIPDHEGAS